MENAKKKRGPQKGSGGRPIKQINIKELIKLCEMQCTKEEICAFFEANEKTLTERIREYTKNPEITYYEFFEQKRQNGKVSLRRANWLKAISKDPRNNNMGIFHLKQHLGMSDKIEVGGMGENFALTQMTPTERDKLLTEYAKKQLQSIQENDDKGVKD
ncbi:MAG: hypothetical protein ACM31H_03835 [Nitrososphaerales archaeon]